MDELPGPLPLLANSPRQTLSAAVSAQASERDRARGARLTAVFRERYRTERPEALEEIDGTPARPKR
ncbi:hypothetical protein M2164_000110 [Streptomyces sp. SAI-208]|nr:hypothetical protein [Streptomyces sp. SAI-208]